MTTHTNPQQPATEPDHVVRRSGRPATRTNSLFSYLRLAFRRGVLFTAIQRQMDSDEPLDPEETWRFWTTPNNPLFQLLAVHWPPRRWRRSFLDRMIAQDHALGIEDHYDVSNEFYRLWLDTDSMFYSCARHQSPSNTLEQAQKNKADFLLTLLEPKPGERILDLGCGWGGMLKAVYSVTNDRDNILGISLSPAQVAFVRNELGFRCEYGNFVRYDYQPGTWDKIYSIGSMEHVRPDEIEPLHVMLFRALPPGGRVVHQFFSMDLDPYSTAMLALQQFFPGTLLSTHQHIVNCMTRAGFVIELDTTDDYRPTLRAWFDTLVANKDTALRLVDVHTYNKYLAFFATSCRFFNDGNARLHRMLLTRR